ncbi:DUF2953 domain-containing protein [Clostridium felsineum]|uniref:Uncharacterized protein n=1 Tax=Clostridium felsineum TaxID=36839 RepID=A0A1S8LPW2_9CLOT|nr:DUF2953 domain-containing protein [Clostridium felsineum]URZ08367.1 hypothetical protein CLROS_037490 [Clostridium felsineum]URZ13398.1 hypothetical protein CROST_041640 [Clostridium felsineum]
MLILKVILIILAVILVLFLLSFFIKMKYNFYSHITDSSLDIDSKITFLFRIIKIKFIRKDNKLNLGIYLFGKKLKFKKKSNKKKQKEKKKSKRKIKWVNILSNIIQYFKEIINILKPKVFKVEGVYGFYDPSLTGITTGIIPILKSVLPLSNVNLQPVFEEEALDIEVEVTGYIIPMVMIVDTLKFILNKEVRKVIFKKD